MQRLNRFANAFFVSIMVFSVVVAVVISTDEFASQEWKKQVAFGALPFFLFALIGLFANTGLKANLLMIAFSAFVTVFLVNAWLERRADVRLEHDGLYRWEVAELYGVPFDRRTKYEVVQYLANSGEDAVPVVNTSFLIPGGWGYETYSKYAENTATDIFPLSGISNAMTVLCNESGQWSICPSDKYGFNNPADAYKSEAERILIVGDSFAQGECVSPDANLAARLREKGYNALSLGMGGNGPLLNLATLIEYAPALKPKVILWMYTDGNDLNNLIDEFNEPILQQYFDGVMIQNLISRQDEVDRFWRAIIQQHEPIAQEEAAAAIQRRRQSRDARSIQLESQVQQPQELRRLVLFTYHNLGIHNFVTFYRIRWLLDLHRGKYPNDAQAKELLAKKEQNEAWTKDQSNRRKDALPLLGPVLRRAIEEASAIDAQLVFVYLPTYYNFAIHPFLDRSGVLQTVKEEGIPIMDFYENIPKTDVPLGIFPFQMGGHYNEKGYSLLADFVAGELRQLDTVSRR